MRESLEAWWDGGARVAVQVGDGGGSHAVFCRTAGDRGPWLTLLHGFPTCSFDWAGLVPTLAKSHRVLALDFLGYGDSDKPAGLRYDTALHADTIEALWRHFGIGETYVAAHDIGTAVAQELLARHAGGRRTARLAGAAFLNGVVIVDHYRPAPIQRLLSNRWTGPLFSAVSNERIFARNLRRAFAPGTQPDDATTGRYWRAMQRRGGHRQLHRLAYYVEERLREGPRWQRALVSSRVPLRFVWGMADPFAGSFVADDIRRHLPHAPIRALEGIGHFPQLEAEADVLADLAAWTAS